MAGYEWAIVTTGPPTIASNGACRTGSVQNALLDMSLRGFWWFTRRQTVSDTVLAQLKAKSEVRSHSLCSPPLTRVAHLMRLLHTGIMSHHCKHIP